MLAKDVEAGDNDVDVVGMESKQAYQRHDDRAQGGPEDQDGVVDVFGLSAAGEMSDSLRDSEEILAW